MNKMNMRSLAFVVGIVATLGLAACKSSSTTAGVGGGVGGNGGAGGGNGGNGGGCALGASGDPCADDTECCSGTCDTAMQCS
jgi:hypothetical protein